jgi:N-acetylmuramoyl-L-alanine amidase
MSKKIIIAVDDGHGLETAGKRTPDGYKENEFNYHCKLFLMEELKRHNIGIIDCSPGRIDNSLLDRANRANKGKANLFVSIHYNALSTTWGNHGGIETFHFPSSVNGKKFATFVQDELIKITGLRNRGVKSANFAVLRLTNMPAILAECGFMDNKKESTLMKSYTHRKNCAIGIMMGICKYLNIAYIPEKPAAASKKNYETILKEVSQWSSTWIDFVNKNHSKDLNLKGLIELLYYTKGS